MNSQQVSIATLARLAGALTSQIKESLYCNFEQEDKAKDFLWSINALGVKNIWVWKADYGWIVVVE